MKPGSFQLGEVVFDPDLRSLTYLDGRPAQLRNKSKEVLVHLLNNRNHTVTKEELLKSIWSDVTVSDESLVQCISDIRRIIGEDARHILETIPRKGYRINTKEPEGRSHRTVLAATVAVVVVAVAGASVIHWRTQDAVSDPPHPTSVETTQHPPGTVSTQAYLEVLKGLVSANRFSLDESLAAERHFRRAIDLDPNFARAYGELGILLAVRFENDWSVLVDADKEKALFYAEKAASLDPESWLAQYALGRLHSVFSDLEAAEKHLVQAMSLQPDNEDARAYLGVVHNLMGDAESAATILTQAIASHPNPPYWYYFALGHAQFNLRRYVEAQEALLTCLDLSPNSPYCLRYLMGIYGVTGDLAKAETAAQTYASMGFDASVGSILSLMPFHHPDDLAQLEWALRQTGLAN